MRTTISSKGQIVLPSPIRRKLSLHAGEQLDATIEGGRIILTRESERPAEARIVTDPETRLPVLTVGAKARPLSSQQVAEMLAEFP